MSDEKFIELLLKELTGNISREEKNELHFLTGSNSYYSRQSNYSRQSKLYKLYWDKSNHQRANSKASFEKVKSKIKQRENSEVN